MKFDKAKNPAAFCLTSAAAQRYPAMAFVSVVEFEGSTFLASTDGCALVMVKAEPGEDDHPSGCYSAEAFAMARKAAGIVTLNGFATVITKDGGKLEFKVSAATPIDIAGVIPRDDGIPVGSIGIDAEMLVKMQKALSAVAVELMFHGRAGVVMVRPAAISGKARSLMDGSFGVIMPVSCG
jgi:hypothetical protein